MPLNPFDHMSPHSGAIPGYFEGKARRRILPASPSFSSFLQQCRGSKLVTTSTTRARTKKEEEAEQILLFLPSSKCFTGRRRGERHGGCGGDQGRRKKDVLMVVLKARCLLLLFSSSLHSAKVGPARLVPVQPGVENRQQQQVHRRHQEEEKDFFRLPNRRGKRHPPSSLSLSSRAANG